MSLSKTEKRIHDRVAKYIAETRFPFADQTDWPEDYQTVVNAGNHQVSGRVMGHTIFPDILVLDGDGLPREAGEVEMDLRPEIVPRLTLASMTVPEIAESGVRHFFLYVPIEIADRASEFVEQYRLSVAGLRAFEVDGDDIHIKPIETKGHEKDHRET